jgi:protein involved in polysaccharide export with SLBB domain
MEENSSEDSLLKYKIPLVITVVGVVLLIGGTISSGLIPRIFIKSQKTAALEPSSSIKMVKVDISGAVVSPGVYELPLGSIIKDAILKAGGVTTQASAEYLSKNLNLAQKVSDGMKLYIPKNGEAGVSVGVVAGVASQGIISLNSSSALHLSSNHSQGSGPQPLKR